MEKIKVTVLGLLRLGVCEDAIYFILGKFGMEFTLNRKIIHDCVRELEGDIGTFTDTVLKHVSRDRIPNHFCSICPPSNNCKECLDNYDSIVWEEISQRKNWKKSALKKIGIRSNK